MDEVNEVKREATETVTEDKPSTKLKNKWDDDLKALEDRAFEVYKLLRDQVEELKERVDKIQGIVDRLNRFDPSRSQ